MLAFSALVLVGVVALWLFALARKARSTTEDRARVLGQRWIIGGGLLLPLLSIVVLLAFGIPAGHRMLPLPLEDGEPLVVEIIGHQWWWEVHYPEAGVVTANELHLPVNVPVDIHLTSSDVIHSFWVPSLAGKLDALPGRTNVLRLEASRTGSFRGQCAEFCGRLHAHMAIEVEVHSAANYAQWIESRQAVNPSTKPDGPAESKTNAPPAAAFREHCGSCHRVAGVSQGGAAPDLSTIGSRSLLGGRPRNEDGGIAYWLANHSATPGVPVPDHSLMAPQSLGDIAEWLETLGDD